jgi:hypothetical protein
VTYADWKVDCDRLTLYHTRDETWYQHKNNQRLVADLEARLLI